MIWPTFMNTERREFACKFERRIYVHILAVLNTFVHTACYNAMLILLCLYHHEFPNESSATCDPYWISLKNGSKASSCITLHRLHFLWLGAHITDLICQSLSLTDSFYAGLTQNNNCRLLVGLPTSMTDNRKQWERSDQNQGSVIVMLVFVVINSRWQSEINYKNTAVPSPSLLIINLLRLPCLRAT